jgi:serine/threonine protein kinase
MNRVPKMQYEYGKFLGRGSFGQVKQAKTLDGRTIAVKIYDISDGMDVNPEIIREISAIQTLSHENIIKMLDVRINPRCIEMAMEFGGSTLGTYMFNITDYHRVVIAPRIFGQLLCAVSYMHRIGFIHRDIKPDNILISNNEHVNICDFSLAKKIIPFRRRQHTYGVCTLNYKAPELFSDKHRDYSIKIDIWSIGCVMFEFLTKKELFGGNTELSVIKSILRTLRPSANDRKCMGLGYLSSNGGSSLSGVFDRISDETMRQLILRMISFIPANRPSARDAIAALGKNKYNDRNDKIINNHNDLRFGKNFFVRMVRDMRTNKELRNQCIDIIDENIEERQTFLVSINIFDMFATASSSALIKKNWEIISYCCCFIASKAIDLKPITLKQLEFVLDGDTILKWENTILKTLEFDIGGPTLLDIYRIAFSYTSKPELPDAHWNMLCEWIRDYNIISNKSSHDILQLIKTTCVD